MAVQNLAASIEQAGAAQATAIQQAGAAQATAIQQVGATQVAETWAMVSIHLVPLDLVG